MQSVPAPARVAVALIALAAAVAVVAVPASSHRRKAEPQVYRGLVGGVPLQSARCEQWNDASNAERSNVAGALAHSVGGASTYGRGTTLSTSEAQGLFDRACASPIAQHWLLYELYIRAAGMRSSYTPQT